SLPPLPRSLAPPCLPCVEGRQRAAPHSSLFPLTTAPLQTLHMDVWAPARVPGQGGERYFLLVVDDYTCYTTVFPLQSKAEDLPVLRLLSDRGGEFSSGLLGDFCGAEGICQTFMLPASPQQNGIAERCIGLVMELRKWAVCWGSPGGGAGGIGSGCDGHYHHSWGSLPPLSPLPALPCLPYIEGRQRAAPHSSSFPPTSAPLQTLHMDMWGPARVGGQDRELYFLLVVDDYTCYTTVFPLRSKGEVPDVFIPWIRAVRLQLCERFREDLPVLRLHSDRGGDFSSNLLRDFCRGEGIL
ncbi:unnamed protein product, partial [Closterium sp. NIES-54]